LPSTSVAQGMNLEAEAVQHTPVAPPSTGVCSRASLVFPLIPEPNRLRFVVDTVASRIDGGCMKRKRFTQVQIAYALAQ